MNLYTEQQLKDYGERMRQHALWEEMGVNDDEPDTTLPEPAVIKLEPGEVFMVDMSAIPEGKTPMDIIKDLRGQSPTIYTATDGTKFNFLDPNWGGLPKNDNPKDHSNPDGYAEIPTTQ